MYGYGRNDDDDRETNEQFVTRMLKDSCAYMHKQGMDLDKAYYGLSVWWAEQQRIELDRRNKVKRDALAKLNSEERELLGLKG